MRFSSSSLELENKNKIILPGRDQSSPLYRLIGDRSSILIRHTLKTSKSVLYSPNLDINSQNFSMKSFLQTNNWLSLYIWNLAGQHISDLLYFLNHWKILSHLKIRFVWYFLTVLVIWGPKAVHFDWWIFVLMSKLLLVDFDTNKMIQTKLK